MARLEAGRCPECGEAIEVDLIEVGDQMYCPGCDCELTVVRLHPPKFKALKSTDLDEIDEDEDASEEREANSDEENDLEEDEL